MATVYNLKSEILNLTEYIHSLYTGMNDNRLLYLMNHRDMDDINSKEQMILLMTNMAIKELDKNDYSNEESYQEALLNYWNDDDAIQVQRISKDSNLYQWLLDWYGNAETLQSKVRSAYETNDALYYVTGVGYNSLDVDLLGGNGSGTQYTKFMAKLTNQSMDK